MNTIVISWAAPYDGNCKVRDYDVRYSTSPIDDSNFNLAAQLFAGITPLTPGQVQNVTVTGLNACTWYYIAIKARDHNLNWSTTSPNLLAKTKCTFNGTCPVDRP